MCAQLDRELTRHRGEIVRSVINTFDHTLNIKVEAGQVLQSTKWLGLEGSDPTNTYPIDLQLGRAAADGGNPQTSTTPATRLIDTKSLLQVTPYHRDKASFLSWKWSFLSAVRAISKPLYEGFMNIEDNMSQDFRKTRLSNEDLELAGQACTLLAMLCKDEACAYVRSEEDGNGHQAWQTLLRARTARSAKKSLESVTGTNLHVTRPAHQPPTVEPKC